MKRYRLRLLDKSTNATVYIHLDAANKVEAQAKIQKLFMRMVDEPLELIEEPGGPGVCCK
jgi:hypothetical protein